MGSVQTHREAVCCCALAQVKAASQAVGVGREAQGVCCLPRAQLPLQQHHTALAGILSGANMRVNRLGHHSSVSVSGEAKRCLSLGIPRPYTGIGGQSRLHHRMVPRRPSPIQTPPGHARYTYPTPPLAHVNDLALEDFHHHNCHVSFRVPADLGTDQAAIDLSRLVGGRGQGVGLGADVNAVALRVGLDRH